MKGLLCTINMLFYLFFLLEYSSLVSLLKFLFVWFPSLEFIAVLSSWLLCWWQLLLRLFLGDCWIWFLRSQRPNSMSGTVLFSGPPHASLIWWTSVYLLRARHHAGLTPSDCAFQGVCSGYSSHTCYLSNAPETSCRVSSTFQGLWEIVLQNLKINFSK